VLQQLLYADEVRSLKDLGIEKVDVSGAELQLALQLIDQISEDSYEPAQFEDAEKKRILAAIDAKIAGNDVVASAHNEEPNTGQVIDLMEALRASLQKSESARSQIDRLGPRKAPKRVEEPVKLTRKAGKRNG
jgi:DNA end-binding protein Ku